MKTKLSLCLLLFIAYTGTAQKLNKEQIANFKAMVFAPKRDSKDTTRVITKWNTPIRYKTYGTGGDGFDKIKLDEISKTLSLFAKLTGLDIREAQGNDSVNYVMSLNGVDFKNMSPAAVNNLVRKCTTYTNVTYFSETDQKIHYTARVIFTNEHAEREKSGHWVDRKMNSRDIRWDVNVELATDFGLWNMFCLVKNPEYFYGSAKVSIPMLTPYIKLLYNKKVIPGMTIQEFDKILEEIN